MPSPPQLDWRTARILAVDPGTVMAVCWGDGDVREWESADLRKAGSHGLRLMALERFLRRFLNAALGIDLMVVELHAASQHRNVVAQGVLSAYRGIVEKLAAEEGVPCVGFYPNTVKAFAGCCGKGLVKDKGAMVRACERLLNVTVTDHNEADAIWIEALARHRMKTGTLFAEKAKRRASRVKSPQHKLF